MEEQYHETLRIDIIASNCSSEIEKEELLKKYHLLNSKSYFEEVFAKKMISFKRDAYLSIVDIIVEYKLNSDEIKSLVRKKYISGNTIVQIEERLKSLNFLKDEFEDTDKKIVYRRKPLF